MFRGLFLIVLIINIRTSSCVIEALYEAGRQVWNLHMIIDNKELDIPHDAKASEHLNDNPMIREMKKQVDVVHEHLYNLEKLMGPKKIRDAIKSWPLNGLMIWKIDTMELFIQNIDEYYKKFHQYKNGSHFSYASFEVLMEEIFSTLQGDIGIIREFATNEKKSQGNEEDLVAVIAGFARARASELCGTPQIISDILIQLFRMIIIAELKTSTMLAYDNIYGYVDNKDKPIRRRINSLAREKLQKQFAIYINIFSFNMPVIDIVYNRACDPPGGNWIRDKSFYELERKFQPLLFDYNSYQCKYENCNNVTSQDSSKCEIIFHSKHIENKAEDASDECTYLGYILACVLDSGPHRFHYVESGELGFLGKNDPCPTGQLLESRTTESTHYAACVCNSYNSQDKVSLLMIESEMNSNRVITGLRFIRKNQVLYIQPREGILKSNGFIDQYSQRWIPIPRNINPSLIERIDKENRVFFLDDLTLPASFVLTGIKFNKVTRGTVSGFAIQIFGTYFNYETGKLFPAEHFRPSRQGSNDESGKSLSFKPVSSVFTNLTHTVTSSDTKYVLLEPSRLEEDFGQSTLPLFDAVPITMSISTALGGVGMFHKGVEGYAGLITLRVYGIQYKEYFNDFQLFHIINDRVLFNSSFHGV